MHKMSDGHGTTVHLSVANPLFALIPINQYIIIMTNCSNNVNGDTQDDLRIAKRAGCLQQSDIAVVERIC